MYYAARLLSRETKSNNVHHAIRFLIHFKLFYNIYLHSIRFSLTSASHPASSIYGISKPLHRRSKCPAGHPCQARCRQTAFAKPLRSKVGDLTTTDHHNKLIHIDRLIFCCWHLRSATFRLITQTDTNRVAVISLHRNSRQRLGSTEIPTRQKASVTSIIPMQGEKHEIDHRSPKLLDPIPTVASLYPSVDPRLYRCIVNCAYRSTTNRRVMRPDLGSGSIRSS